MRVNFRCTRDVPIDPSLRFLWQLEMTRDAFFWQNYSFFNFSPAVFPIHVGIAYKSLVFRLRLRCSSSPERFVNCWQVFVKLLKCRINKPVGPLGKWVRFLSRVRRAMRVELGYLQTVGEASWLTFRLCIARPCWSPDHTNTPCIDWWPKHCHL